MIERRHSRRTAPPHPAGLVLRFRLSLSTFNCRLLPSPCANSFSLTSLSDPHLLNTVVSYLYKNHSRDGANLPLTAQSGYNVSLLHATHPSPLLCVANKGLAQSLCPLDATLTKNIGRWGLPSSCLILNPWIATRRAPSCLCPEAAFPA